MSHYKPYPAYKDSVVEWLGRVPEHWEVKPLKYVGSAIIGLTYSPDDLVSENEGTLVLRSSNIQNGRVFLGDNVFVNTKIPSALVTRLGDILICSRNGSRALIGKNALIDSASVGISFGAFTTVFRSAANAFVYYVLNSELFRFQSGRFLTTTINQLTTETLNSFEIPLPPPTEQMQIANSLDRETARIDSLVEKKTRFIELLREKRQALITHAVTKGLDPNVKMKDSGVEWLGEVPEHWDCCLFKHKCLKVTDGAHISPDTVNGVHFFVSTKDIVEDHIDFEGALRTSADSYEYLVRTGCNPVEGDVLFSKDGTIGRTVVVREAPDFVVASSLIIIRPEPRALDSVFFNYFCQSKVVVSQVESLVRGAGLPRISIQNLLKIIGAFPPLCEQRAVVEFLDTEASRIHSLVRTTERSIDLLKERRSALITAAVTGQIDLREAV